MTFRLHPDDAAAPSGPATIVVYYNQCRQQQYDVGLSSGACGTEPVSEGGTQISGKVTRAAIARKARRELDLDVLTGHLGYYLRRAQVGLFQDFIRTLSPIDLRPAQFSVLVVIGANPGLSQAELADVLAIERARLVHMLDKLQARGLVQRLASATDRRRHALQLTRAGQKLLKRAKALAGKHEARLTDKLGAETRECVRESVMRLLGAFTEK